MTVTTTTARNVKAPNGVATTFPFDFAFEVEVDLVVTRIVTATGVETLQALTTDYTVTGGSGSVGTIEMVTPPPGPDIETLVIERNVAFTQSVDYQRNDPFPAEVNETALDRLTFLVQQVLDFSQRALRLKKSTTLTDVIFPDPEVGKILVGKNATEFENKTVSDLDPTVTALPLSVANGGTNATTAAAARSNIGLEIGTDVQAWDDNLDDIAALSHAAGNVVVSDGTDWTAGPPPLPRSYLTGLVLSNNGTDAVNDVDIAVGEARSRNNTTDLIVASAIGKRIDASWAAGGTPGSTTGGLSSSLSLANDTWYHVIVGKVSGTVEVGFDTSLIGNNLITDHSFTNIRRLGSVRRGTALIVLFIQDGDEFWWENPPLDVDDTGPTASAAGELYTLTTPPNLRTKAIVRTGASSTDGESLGHFRDPNTDDELPSRTAAPLFNAGGRAATGAGLDMTEQNEIWTNGSSQIKGSIDVTSGSAVLRVVTLGWIDRRGRDD